MGAAEPRDPHPALALSLLAVLVTTAGCLGPEIRQSASAALSGSTGDSVSVVTSVRFNVAQSQDPTGIILAESDTATVRLPFEREFDIGETRRFFIRVLPPLPADPEAPESEPAEDDSLLATLRVRVDGELMFDRTSDVLRQRLEFYFRSRVSR